MAWTVSLIKDGVVDGHETPLERVVAERELQNPICGDPHLAVWLGRAGHIKVRAAGADRELPDAGRAVRTPVGILSREDLIDVIVRAQDDVAAELHERPPEIPRRAVGCTAVGTGAEQGAMPVRQRALRFVGLQLVPQPLPLRRRRTARQFAIERDDPPRAGGKRVVAETTGPCESAEVIVVAGSARRLVLVVAGNRTRALEMTPPRRVVTIAEVGRGPLHVGEVAERQQRPRQAIEQRPRLERAKAAFADVPGCKDRGRGLGAAATAAAAAGSAAR